MYGAVGLVFEWQVHEVYHWQIQAKYGQGLPWFGRTLAVTHIKSFAKTGNDEIAESDDKCIAWVKQAKGIDLTIVTYVSSNRQGSKYYDASGWQAIRAHERRRATVYKLGYDEYLAPIQRRGNAALACGTVHGKVPGEAKDALNSWLSDLRAKARDQFRVYNTRQQALIGIENLSWQTRGRRIVGPPATIHQPMPPPPLDIPDCPYFKQAVGS
ncbi:MAG: hypothetical protein JXR37_15870 [Kiritimatiellae bacterium]|nr:hypothetical protein [Kiritimatiellia bacterium]